MKSTNTALKRWKLHLAAAAGGYATLTIESTGTALLAPYFGATSIVWTVQIAIALLGVLFGYLIGRRFSRTSPGTWLLAGGVYTFTITQLATSLLPLSYQFSYWPALLGAATVLYLPAATLINAVYPALAGEASNSSTDAFVTVAAAGTLGAICALGNSLWLPQTIGLRLALSTAGGLVIFVGLLHKRPGPTAAWFTAFCIMTAAFPTARPEEPAMEKQRWEDTEGLTQVIENHGSEMLVRNGICQTIETSSHTAAPCVETAVRLTEEIHARNALVIGVGGGSFPKRLALKGIPCDSVDTSENMVKAAVAHFGFNSDRTRIGDGRRYLATSRQRYDFIFLDAFTGDEPAGHLLTREAAVLFYTRLGPEGILAINLVNSAPCILDPLNSAVIKTFRSAFPCVTAWAIGQNNLLILAGATLPGQTIWPSPRQSTDGGIILTDNRNPARQLYGTTGQKLREALRKFAKSRVE